MSVALIVLSVLLAMVTVGTAIAKLMRVPAAVETMDRVGVPRPMFSVLAALELLGATGLLLGLAWTPLGVAAATGLCLFFVGAVAAHLRVQDREIGIPLVLALLCGATAGLFVVVHGAPW